MAYQNYLRNLDFGGVSDSIQTLKSQEYGRLTNSLDAKSFDLQGQINKLTEDESLKDKLESTVTTIGDATGISFENGSVGKLVDGVKEKLGSLKDAASKLKSKFQDGLDSVKSKASDLKSSAEDQLSDLKSSVSDKVSDVKAQFTGDAPTKAQPQEIEMRTFSSDETKSDVPDGDNPNEIAYSSDNPGVPQTRGGDVEMQDFTKNSPGSEIEMQDFSTQPATDNYLGSLNGGGGNFGKRSYAETLNEENSYGSGNLLQRPSETAEIAQPTSSEGTTVADTTAKGGDVASDGANVAEDAAGAVEEGAATAGEAAEGAAEAGEIAGEVAGDVAVEAGTEVAGAALDSTGILAPLGILLQVGGAIFGGVETAKAAMDEKSMTSDENVQNTIAEQKNAIQKNIANQQFIGANVTPGLSSITANAVTSGAF